MLVKNKKMGFIFKKQFFRRLLVAWKILFRYDHVLVTSLTTDELKKSLSGEGFNVEGYKICLTEYNHIQIITQMAESFDSIDLALAKAELEANAGI